MVDLKKNLKKLVISEGDPTIRVSLPIEPGKSYMYVPMAKTAIPPYALMRDD